MSTINVFQPLNKTSEVGLDFTIRQTEISGTIRSERKSEGGSESKSGPTLCMIRFYIIDQISFDLSITGSRIGVVLHRYTV